MASLARTALDEMGTKGEFKRTDSVFRDTVAAGHPRFEPEAHRYHLYIGLACPGANRCFTVLHLKGLEHVIGVTVVHPTWARTRPNDPADTHCGWAFHDSATGAAVSSSTGEGSFVIGGCAPDAVNGAAFVRDLYEMVPVPRRRCVVRPPLF
jgi:putative glutathione S-transferase